MKRLIIIISAIVISACEAGLDYSRVESDECIYVNAIIGNYALSAVNAYVAIPMNSEDYGKCRKTVSVSGSIGGRPMALKDHLGDAYFDEGTQILNGEEIHPGDMIEIKASAEGVSDICARTKVPEEINLISARIVERKRGFITFEIIYEEEPGYEGYYGIYFYNNDISEGPGLLLPESYDMIVSHWSGGEIVIWDRHKVSREGNVVTFRTSVEIRDGINASGYLVTLYSLSPETFYYLRGEYIRSSTGFAALGMGTPAFTYSNVIGGTGIAGSYWGTDITLNQYD